MPGVDFITNLPAEAVTNNFRDSLVQTIADMLTMPVELLLTVLTGADCQIGLTTSNNATEPVVGINVGFDLTL